MRPPTPVVLPSGREVALCDLRPDDHEWAYRLMADPSVTAWWRSRGRPPDPGEFHALLYGGVRHSAVAKCGGRPIALLQLMGDERTDGHLDLSVLGASDAPAGMLPVAAAAYLRYAFATMNLHKVYLALAAPNLVHVGALAGVATLEGRLADHLAFGRERHDVLVHSVRAAQVDEYLRSLGVDTTDSAPTASGPTAADLVEWCRDRPHLDDPHGPPIVERLDSLDLAELLAILDGIAGRPLEPEALAGCVDTTELVAAAAAWADGTAP